VRAAKLRHPIVIQQSTATQTVGEPVLSWSTFANERAAYEDLGGSEGPAGGQQQFAVGFRRYEIRYRTDLTTKMRILHQSIGWDIDRIVNVGGRGRELHLFCTGRSLP
jgi:head-tail adaptor